MPRKPSRSQPSDSSAGLAPRVCQEMGTGTSRQLAGGGNTAYGSEPVPISLQTLLSRRAMMRVTAGSAMGLGLADLLSMKAHGSTEESLRRGFGRARSCIILFAWGGMSHIDTWDMKPEADDKVRGLFKPIQTATPGIFISEHLPHLARQTHRMAIIRSVHHQTADHRMAAYWNITGHAPESLGGGGVTAPILPSRKDWPSIGSMVAKAIGPRPVRLPKLNSDEPETVVAALPGTITLPYPIADRGLQNGQYGGFLGAKYDPVFMQPGSGKRYAGKSPNSGILQLGPQPGLSYQRMNQRRSLLGELDGKSAEWADRSDMMEYREQAMEMLLSPSVRGAFDVSNEPRSTREAYGDHICGQSLLMALRLTEAGVPLITVYCSSGDLNGSVGDNFDTHGDNFNRLKRDLLPPLDRGSSALLDDLAARGLLDDTLVVWMTEFGRTPQIGGGAGRDHFPHCYSVVFAGAGVQGGQIYGKSDKIGSKPVDAPCTPGDLHATIFHALGIDPHTKIQNLQSLPLPMSTGRPLPLF